MTDLRLGIIGSGMIAGVIAKAISQIDTISLTAISSRQLENAKAFAQDFNIPHVFETVEAMVASSEIDAVYIATPTAVKEQIALTAAQAKKHLLVDKPFANAASVERIIAAALDNEVLIMDATHFTHNPRTTKIKTEMENTIGTPQALRSSFFFPFMDRSNIRFNPEKEPTGAVGDMTWYSMRAIVEYLNPQAPVKSMSGGIVRDKETGAVIRGSGLVVFDDGQSSSFDFGYNTGACLMDLDILGHDGVITMSDFVLDWKNGFAFDNQDHVNGYHLRQGMAKPEDFKFVEADSDEPQTVAMMRNFAKLTQDPNSANAKSASALALQTQNLLDAYWNGG